MKRYRFTSNDGNVDVTFRTDLIQNDGNFKILEINGIEPKDATKLAATIAKGFTLRKWNQLQYHSKDVILHAQTYNLNLVRITEGGATVTLNTQV